MLTKSFALALSLTALMTTPSPADYGAHACGIVVAGDHSTGGDEWTGLLYGVVAEPGQPVSITCSLRVDGVTVAGAGPATGESVAVTAGTVSYHAAGPKSVEVCAEWTAGPESGARCTPSPNVGQGPPLPFVQEIVDLINCCVDYPDLLHCPILAGLSPGVPGVVDIDNQGDVFVLGNWIWDCPPYGF